MDRFSGSLFRSSFWICILAELLLSESSSFLFEDCSCTKQRKNASSVDPVCTGIAGTRQRLNGRILHGNTQRMRIGIRFRRFCFISCRIEDTVVRSADFKNRTVSCWKSGFGIQLVDIIRTIRFKATDFYGCFCILRILCNDKLSFLYWFDRLFCIPLSFIDSEGIGSWCRSLCKCLFDAQTNRNNGTVGDRKGDGMVRSSTRKLDCIAIRIGDSILSIADFYG